MQCICMGAHDVCFPFYEETKLRIMNWILRRDIAESKITTENLRTMSHVNNLQNDAADSYEGGGEICPYGLCSPVMSIQSPIHVTC